MPLSALWTMLVVLALCSACTRAPDLEVAEEDRSSPVSVSDLPAPALLLPRSEVVFDDWAEVARVAPAGGEVRVVTTRGAHFADRWLCLGIQHRSSTTADWAPNGFDILRDGDKVTVPPEGVGRASCLLEAVLESEGAVLLGYAPVAEGPASVTGVLVLAPDVEDVSISDDGAPIVDRRRGVAFVEVDSELASRIDRPLFCDRVALVPRSIRCSFS